MRFILLRKRSEKSFFDSILKIGCGPNFVLNRCNSFENMIKEQGVTFWFRFWLTVCFNHCSFHLRTIEAYFPDMLFSALACMHKEFLQGSEEDASLYCIKVIKSMRITENNNLIDKVEAENKKEIDLALLKDMVKNTIEFIFGAALCEIFYKWLSANEMDDKSQKYWSIPEEYLDINFQPGKLEKYLVHGWKEKLFTLFDVSENRVPWVAALLEDKIQPFPSLSQEDICNYAEQEKFIEEIRRSMKIDKNERIKEMQAVDEFPDNKENKLKKPVSSLINKSSNHRNFTEESFQNKVEGPENYITNMSELSLCSEIGLFDKKKSKTHVCCFCGSQNDDFTRLIMCQQCENDVTPNYYCSATCQVEHCFKVHSKKNSSKSNVVANDRAEKKKSYLNSFRNWKFVSSLFITVLLILCSTSVLDFFFFCFKLYF